MTSTARAILCGRRRLIGSVNSILLLLPRHGKVFFSPLSLLGTLLFSSREPLIATSPLFLDDQLSLPDPLFLRGEGHICSWSERLRRRSKGLNTREEKRLGVSNFHVAKRRGRNRFPASNFPFFSARVSIFFLPVFSLSFPWYDQRPFKAAPTSISSRRKEEKEAEREAFFSPFPSPPLPRDLLS